MMKETMKKITVFGGAQPTTGQPAYEDAYRLGGLLAAYGFAVATGGYIGIMEAVSRGAAENGGHVIGVTCDEIEAYRPSGPNQWVMEEIRAINLRERMFGMIELCDAALALPGGTGTLAEIALMWNYLLIRAIPAKPLILIGRGWQATMSQFIQSFSLYIPDGQAAWLQFAPDVDQAVKQLKSIFNS